MLLHRNFRELKEFLNEKNASKMLLASTSFCVANACLGGGTQMRVAPASLEDYFSLVHQTMLTVGAHAFQNKGANIKVKELPLPIKNICENILKINLHNSYGSFPFIQSIEFNYPNLKIIFNAPLNVHSASFSLFCKLGPSGVDSIVFESSFFVSIGAFGSVGRAQHLFLYGVNSCYAEGEMQLNSPINYEFKYERDTAKLQWEVPTDELAQLDFSKKASYHLQNMIEFLQHHKDIPYVSEKIYEDFPQFYPLSRNKPLEYSAFLRGVVKNPRRELIETFVNTLALRSVSKEDLLNIKFLLQRALELDSLWNENSWNLIDKIKRAESMMIQQGIGRFEEGFEKRVLSLKQILIVNFFQGDFSKENVLDFFSLLDRFGTSIEITDSLIKAINSGVTNRVLIFPKPLLKAVFRYIYSLNLIKMLFTLDAFDKKDPEFFLLVKDYIDRAILRHSEPLSQSELISILSFFVMVLQHFSEFKDGEVIEMIKSWLIKHREDLITAIALEKGLVNSSLYLKYLHQLSSEVL